MISFCLFLRDIDDVGFKSPNGFLDKYKWQRKLLPCLIPFLESSHNDSLSHFFPE
jgi:hypothetical protein